MTNSSLDTSARGLLLGGGSGSTALHRARTGRGGPVAFGAPFEGTRLPAYARPCLEISGIFGARDADGVLAGRNARSVVLPTRPKNAVAGVSARSSGGSPV